MRLQVGVKVLVKNHKNEYLFIERSDSLPDGSGIRWDIPGGRIEAQERLLDALERELNEETGMKFKGDDPHLLDAQDIMIPEAGLHVVRLTYLMQAEGDLHLGDEHAKYEWRTLEDAKLLNVDGYLRNTLTAIRRTT